MTVSIRTLVAAFAMIAAAGSADARRTVIDQSEDGTQTILEVGGYCDLDGEDCLPVNLGYTVDFGTGPLSSLLIYGNGVLAFGPTALNPTIFSNALIDYGVPYVTPGLDNSTEEDFQGDGDEVFFQSAALQILSGGTIIADFFRCETPEFCHLNSYSATLVPTAAGYNTTFSYSSPSDIDGFTSGFVIPGGPSASFADRVGRTFLIPASFTGLQVESGVPEPSTWLSMILGFGLVGFALRRRSSLSPRPVRLAAV